MMLITSMRLFLLKRKEASLAIQFTFPTRVRFDCVGVRMGFSTVSEHFQCIKSTYEKRNEIDKIFILSVYKIDQLSAKAERAFSIMNNMYSVRMNAKIINIKTAIWFVNFMTFL